MGSGRTPYFSESLLFSSIFLTIFSTGAVCYVPIYSSIFLNISLLLFESLDFKSCLLDKFRELFERTSPWSLALLWTKCQIFMFEQRQILEARALRKGLRRRGRLHDRHNLSKDLRNHSGDIGKQSVR
ncbi:hypothetical protein B9Z55_007466 [Caenorhabditis nigoni]|uniref:Uncharacterized protein n=1 Tax=Caenorhabditis nigoni TaxID=1611254 RepID=A0A2G5V9Y0_9PELO|nr:hypothetical protein B9Z55_007466 [Caenorhabditis nigoni]